LLTRKVAGIHALTYTMSFVLGQMGEDILSADASDTIEHLKSEHSENSGDILSL
jgi:hypothetical protein